VGLHVKPVQQPLPTWAKSMYAFVALVTGLVGLGFFVAPATTAPIWFWPLAPLLARMAAAWLIGVSSVAVLMIAENDLSQSRISAATLIAYAILQGVVLLRYALVVNWAAPLAWVWVAMLLVLLVVNGYVLFTNVAQNIFQQLAEEIKWKQNA
jgi:hypothetical protein